MIAQKLNNLARWLNEAARNGRIPPEVLTIAAAHVEAIADQVTAQTGNGVPVDLVDRPLQGRPH